MSSQSCCAVAQHAEPISRESAPQARPAWFDQHRPRDLGRINLRRHLSAYAQGGELDLLVEVVRDATGPLGYACARQTSYARRIRKTDRSVRTYAAKLAARGLTYAVDRQGTNATYINWEALNLHEVAPRFSGLNRPPSRAPSSFRSDRKEFPVPPLTDLNSCDQQTAAPPAHPRPEPAPAAARPEPSAQSPEATKARRAPTPPVPPELQGRLVALPGGQDAIAPLGRSGLVPESMAAVVGRLEAAAARFAGQGQSFHAGRYSHSVIRGERERLEAEVIRQAERQALAEGHDYVPPSPEAEAQRVEAHDRAEQARIEREAVEAWQRGQSARGGLSKPGAGGCIQRGGEPVDIGAVAAGLLGGLGSPRSTTPVRPVREPVRTAEPPPLDRRSTRPLPWAPTFRWPMPEGLPP